MKPRRSFDPVRKPKRENQPNKEPNKDRGSEQVSQNAHVLHIHSGQSHGFGMISRFSAFGPAAESRFTYSPVRGQELPDRGDCALIDVILRFAIGLELGLGDEERMISSLDDVQLVYGSHLVSNIFEQVERTERIASALHKEDRRPQRQKNFVAQLRAVTGATERIAEAYNRRDFLFESKMTSNPRAHAFAD